MKPKVSQIAPFAVHCARWLFSTIPQNRAIADHFCHNGQELEGAISKMTHPKTGQLLLYRSSERYLDRVTADMQQKAGQEKKFRRWAECSSLCKFMLDY